MMPALSGGVTGARTGQYPFCVTVDFDSLQDNAVTVQGVTP